MRRTVPLLRGAKGFGWYGKFKREGSEGFRKFTPPTPFDWSTSPSISANNSSGPTDSPARPKAVLEISYGGKPMGALKVELAQDVVPKTVSNFLTLCNETSQRTYKGSKLHQIRKGSYIMGGDVENLDGTGNHSAHPEQRFLPEENFIIPHTSRGLVSMVSSGRDTVGSQFYISLGDTAFMNGRCVVFGRVVAGDDVLASIEKLYTVRGEPTSDLIITACGVEM